MTYQEYEAFALHLARAHLVSDPSTEEVYLAADPAGRVIRLVEVVEGVPTTGEILPFRFEPNEQTGVPLPSVLILLSREEWQQCRDGRLQLPPDWGRPGDLQRIA